MKIIQRDTKRKERLEFMGLLYAGGGNPIKGRTVKKKGISRQKLSGLRGVSSPLQLVLLAATGSILQLLVPPQLAPLQ